MYKKVFKRLIDIVISLLAMPFIAIILLIFAPIIHLTDKGPVFYNGERLGYKCKHFKMFKLRSMKMNAPDLRNSDGSTYNSENDPRLTSLGGFLRKTSLDELPQFINVLVGDMSIIGPRPGTTDSELTDNEQKRRSVRPGITGYSQALMRNSDSMEERMRNDVFYAENVSFKLDCYIFFKTIQSVLIKKNIYRNTESDTIVVESSESTLVELESKKG